MRDGQEIRSELGTAMTHHGLRWRDVDQAGQQILTLVG